MSRYFCAESICEENKVLRETIASLEAQIQRLKDKNRTLNQVIDARNQKDAVEILEYFHSCSSIRNTACKYNMEMEELYESIPEWDGCRDGLQSADDYHECRIEVIGRQEYDAEQECDLKEEELEHLMRTPEPDEIAKIIADYNEPSLSLYGLADKYELKIINLFRLLKENNVIDKETDAKNYQSFYEEHNGAGTEWDYKSEFGLIEAFYDANL
jgi:hypothetical protein